MTRIHTIDAHTAGEPLRLIVSGFPTIKGRTILEQREYVRKRHDRLRRALMLEPRGHADMYGALLTPPEREGSHAGVLFMHNEGFSTMCGHGVIAVTTIAIERDLIVVPREADGTMKVTLDSPAGPIQATAVIEPATQPSKPAASVMKPFGPAVSVAQPFSAAASDQGSVRVTSVSFRNVPSFVLHASVPIRAGGREIGVDVAFGGAFYAIVDSEAVGVPIVRERLADLRRIGMEIKHEVERAVRVEHPLEPQLWGIYGTIFTGQPSDSSADLRNVTVFADAEVDRSPCGTGTCAVMAVLAAMGLLGRDQTFTHESIIGTKFRGRVVDETSLPPPAHSPEPTAIPAIVPEIEGEAYITGENSFILDDRDPLRDGFRL